MRVLRAAPELLDALKAAQDYFNCREEIVNNTCKEHRYEAARTRIINDKNLDQLFELNREKATAAIANTNPLSN